MGDEGIRRQEPSDLRIIKAAFHVDEAQLFVVLVPGEAPRGEGRERDRGGSPLRIPAGAEGVLAPLLGGLTPGLVRHGLDGAESPPAGAGALHVAEDRLPTDHRAHRAH
jgi:hypothetical protein